MKCPKCGSDKTRKGKWTCYCFKCGLRWMDWQQQEIDALKPENEKLKARIEELEAQIPKTLKWECAGCANRDAQIKDLEARLKDVEKKIKELESIISLLPIDHFNKDPETIDAAEFVDYCDGFLRAMDNARGYFERNGR